VARGCQEAAEGIHESRGQQEAAGDSQGSQSFALILTTLSLHYKTSYVTYSIYFG